VPSALAASPPGIITTVAGGPGRGAAVGVAQAPQSVLAGPGGTVYVGDQNVVRELSIASSSEKVLAGLGTDDGVSSGVRPASQTLVGDITGMALDATGNLVIPDGDNKLQVVAAKSGTFYGRAMTAGDVYTLGPLGSPETNPWAVAVDSAGNVVFTEEVYNEVRVLAERTGTFYGQAMTAGDIYTIAGTGPAGTPGGYNGDGIPAVSAELSGPSALTIDKAGNVLIADTSNNRIRVIAVSSGTFYGQAMTAGDIYSIAGNGTMGFSGDRGPATQAKLGLPLGLTLDGAGNVLIADTNNMRVRVLAATSGSFYGRAMTAGDIYTLAGNGQGLNSGNGGLATRAFLYGPEGVAVDADGNVVIADTPNDRVRVVAASTGTFYGHKMTAGHIYAVAGNGSALFSGDKGAARSAELNLNGGLAVDHSGNIVMPDAQDEIRVVAHSSGTFYGQKMTAGNIYAIAGDGRPGITGEGGPGTKARIATPSWPTIDSAGNVLFGDASDRLLVVAASTGTFYGQAMTAGYLYTLAGNGTAGETGDGGPATSAELYGPGGVAVDTRGNVLISDDGRIRVIAAASGTFYGQAMTAGYIYTIAGNGTGAYNGNGIAALNAGIAPAGLAVDGAGNVLFAEPTDERVRVVAEASGTFYGQAMTAGDVYTLAGNGIWKFTGDGGPAIKAKVGWPMAVAVDAAGNLLFTDTGNTRIRAIAAASGTFYGQAMTAGDIYTIAGNGKIGLAGDGQQATSAWLNWPDGIAVDASGDLLISDSRDYRVREITG
jgi:hypothetical protein